MRLVSLVLSGVLIAAPATVLAEGSPAPATPAASARAPASARALAALKLPSKAGEARAAGVAAHDVDDLLGAVASAEVDAAEALDALVVSEAAAREGAPLESLGAYVREQAHQGVRGGKLAAAIRGEKARRGADRAAAEHGSDHAAGEPGKRAERPTGEARREAASKRGGGEGDRAPRFDSSQSEAEIQAGIEQSQREAEERAAARAAKRSGGGDAKAPAKTEPAKGSSASEGGNKAAPKKGK